MFVASFVKIKTIDKDVLDSEWTLTSCALRLVCKRWTAFIFMITSATVDRSS